MNYRHLKSNGIHYDLKVLFSKKPNNKLVTQFGTMCLKCGQDVWNIYAWPKLSSDIVSHSLQGSSFHFRSWAQYWLCGSWSVWGLDERTPVKDNTSVLAQQFLNRSSSRMWFIQMEQKMRNVQCWGESFKNRRSLRRYKWCVALFDTAYFKKMNILFE